MVDSAGTVVWQADYLPFGKAEVDPSSTVENNIRFPGQYYDEERGCIIIGTDIMIRRPEDTSARTPSALKAA